MKTPSNPSPCVRLAALDRRKGRARLFRRVSIGLCCLGFTLPASARDLFGIPLPPPPHQVIREVRSKIHRAANEIKTAGRRAVAEVAHDDDDGGTARHTHRARRSVRPAPPVTRYSPGTRYQEDRAFDRDMERSTPVPERTSPRMQREMSETEIARQRESATTFPRGSEDRHSLSPENMRGVQQPPPSRQSSTTAQQSKPAGENAVQFARPVPGKRGMVYPPGAEESSENMIDVEGFQPGQVVRDPRTGALFRVP